MSPSEPSPRPPPEPEEDRLPYGRLLGISLMALAAFAVGGLWSAYILYRPTRELVPERHLPQPPELGRPEIGIVNQRLFVNDLRAEQERLEQTRRLHSYGWVDRKSGVIHIPIERAMELFVEGHR
jgi:hypothetical protein